MWTTSLHSGGAGYDGGMNTRKYMDETEVLREVRKILGTPDGASIIDHAKKIAEEAWKYRDLCD